MAVGVLWLFLVEPWVGLQCVIVVFPDHTHLLFQGGGSVVVDSLFYEPPIVCGGSVFGLCFVMHYFVSSLF